jgi:hypothetical protein
MVGMGSNLVVAAFLAALMIGIAIPALGVLISGAWIWNKKRGLAVAFIIPSSLYLLFFLYVFVPRPLPSYEVHLDLRHPTDLSGIPADTRWFSGTWPPPAEIVPLSPPGGSCCVEGKVDITIVLPDGNIIHDIVRNVFIDTDDAGIWKVFTNVYSAEPRDALQRFKPYVWPIALSSKYSPGQSTPLDKIENDLLTYKAKQALADGLRVEPTGCKLQFAVETTFLPSDKVAYFYLIELPHVPEFERFVPLPKVDQPEQLVRDCRQLLGLDTGTLADVEVKSSNWPTSVASLNPVRVWVHQKTVLLCFDSHAVTGSHCFAVSSGELPGDPQHIRVILMPFPGLNEVQVHN